MKVTLPKPPTTNHIYGFTSKGGFARSYVTKEGKLFFEEAEKIIKKVWKKKPIEAPCEVWIQVYTSRMRDVDGSAKPILDALQKNGVVKNDSQFYKMDIERFSCKVGEDRVEVEIMGY